MLLLDVDFMVGGGPITDIVNHPGIQAGAPAALRSLSVMSACIRVVLRFKAYSRATGLGGSAPTLGGCHPAP